MVKFLFDYLYYIWTSSKLINILSLILLYFNIKSKQFIFIIKINYFLE